MRADRGRADNQSRRAFQSSHLGDSGCILAGSGVTMGKLNTTTSRVGFRARPPRVTIQHLSVTIVDDVIQALRQTGRDILLTDCGIHLYVGGGWRCADAVDQLMLKAMIQRGCERAGRGDSVALARSAWTCLTESPNLFAQSVDWNKPGLAVVGNGVLDLDSLQLGPFYNRYYRRAKAIPNYIPGAQCPIFLALLDSMFADRSAAHSAWIVATLQEFAGLALDPRCLSEDQRKGLCLVGLDSVGKTLLARLLVGLFSSRTALTSLSEVSRSFRLDLLASADSWICEGGLSSGKRFEAHWIECVVVGQRFEVHRLAHPTVEVQLQIPVILIEQTMPSESVATITRLRFITIMMNCLVSPAQECAARQRLGLPVAGDIVRHIFAAEGPGILNWALDGLQRIRARRRFILPAENRF